MYLCLKFHHTPLGKYHFIFVSFLRCLGGIFLRPLWDLIYSYYYNTQLSITELLFSIKGPMPIAGEIESQRHSFPDQSQYYLPLLTLPPLPQIISLSSLQLKDICSFFPSPFSLFAGRGRTSKVVLGLLIILPPNIMYLESPESCEVAGSSKDR